MTTSTRSSRSSRPTRPPPFGPRGALGVVLFPALVVVIARTLAAFATRIAPYLVVHYDWRLELGLVVGQVLFQWCFLLRHPRDEKLSYAWIVIAVSSLGAVLLWPLLVFVPASAGVLPNLAWFFTVVAIMFAVHFALVARHRLPKRLCLTWVVYRLLILIFVVRWR